MPVRVKGNAWRQNCAGRTHSIFMAVFLEVRGCVRIVVAGRNIRVNGHHGKSKVNFEVLMVQSILQLGKVEVDSLPTMSK